MFKNIIHFSLFEKKYVGYQDKMLVRELNREDPDQTASSEAAWFGSALFAWYFFCRQLVFFLDNRIKITYSGYRFMQ